MIKLSIINITEKKFEYYTIDREDEKYIFMEDVQGLGVAYTVLKRFQTKKELDHYLFDFEQEKKSIFSKVNEKEF
ncbi:hypothetical protein L3V86_09365 [Thiotrichales bacterium 19S11-10]|nr:hypothetical protein [Thiotrichales bacterium 19S11-10]